jgi:hypothetical protein
VILILVQEGAGGARILLRMIMKMRSIIILITIVLNIIHISSPKNKL